MFEEKMLSIISVLEKSVVKTAEVASKQLPLLVQEILKFKALWHGVSFGVCLFFLLIGLLVFVIERNDNDFRIFIGWWIFSWTVMGAFPFYYLLMIKVAPRLYLLGYIKELIK